MTDNVQRPVCAACNHLIKQGEASREVNTPEGPVPVHEACLRKPIRRSRKVDET
jgi:hypothetical protein